MGYNSFYVLMDDLLEGFGHGAQGPVPNALRTGTGAAARELGIPVLLH